MQSLKSTATHKSSQEAADTKATTLLFNERSVELDLFTCPDKLKIGEPETQIIKCRQCVQEDFFPTCKPLAQHLSIFWSHFVMATAMS
jgi:hypothetical protein